MKTRFPDIVYAVNEKLLGRDTLALFREFKKEERASCEDLRDIQSRKMKKLLLYAYNSTGYYKEAMDKAGFDPAAMLSLDDIQKVPFLTKEEIRANTERIIAKDTKGRLKRYATSGSTGHPLIFYLSNERIAANKAAYLMLYGWWGLRIGDREVVLWGSSRDISAYSITKKIRDNLLHTRLLPAFRIGEAEMSRYIAFIRKYRPKDIFGYAHSIYLLARFADNRGIKLNNIGLRVVFTTAELLHDFQRDLIRKVFGCPVSNCYGGRESGLIAFECPGGNMHLNPAIYTEFVNGEIVVTDLYSYGMPFIRYRTGDRGILSAKKGCSCGISAPIIEKLIGRDTDHVISPKGELIHPLALEYIFRELEGIDYFRIVQKKKDELVVDLVVVSKFDKTLEGTIKNKIDQVMGAPVKTSFNYIKDSEIPSQDKYKFVISEVKDIK